MRVKLLDHEDIRRSLGADSGPFDTDLADWVIEMVSAAALDLTGRDWKDPLDVPVGALAILALAARRLYSNPDRFTRESEGDYSYGLDATVTKAGIFTPDEAGRLKAFRQARRVNGLETISTYRGDVRSPDGTVYVPDGGLIGFPWYNEGDL